uniref:glycosyltransferase family 2 protein n=1 Tax=Halodesulfovibrio sp. TaxID=1912772 RepID=UPI0025C11411
GLLYDFGKIKRRFAGCFDIENGMFILRQDATRGEAFGHKLYDIVLNFFMARTESIRRVGWDPELRLGEHKDFFIRAKEHGLKCTVLDNVSIFHFPEQSDDYAEYRNRARAYEMLAFKKHGIYAEKIIQPISATRLWRSVKTFLKKSSFLVSLVHLLKKKLT